MIYGIDVSKFQGKIQWDEVAAAGKKFVFIKLGNTGYEGGIRNWSNGYDPYFETNVTGARAAGIEVGAYVYSYCQTATAARTAAREVLEIVKDYEITYPVVFDMEVDGTGYALKTKEENTAIANAFLSVIEEGGYYAMLYTFKSFAESYLNMKDLRQHDFWLAHYTDKTDYVGNYGIWQYRGNATGNIPAGTCPGVSGDCDLDVAYMDYAAVIRAAGKNGFAPDEEIIGEIEEEQDEIQGEVENGDPASCERCRFLQNTLEKILKLAQKAQ